MNYLHILFLTLPALLLAASIVLTVYMVKKGIKPRRAMTAQVFMLLVIMAVCLTLPVAAADAAGPAEAEAVSTSGDGLKYIGAALSVGLAAIGGGIAVAAGAPAAIGATSEDPKAFGKALIFVALGEGFGLYGLLIAILCIFS